MGGGGLKDTLFYTEQLYKEPTCRMPKFFLKTCTANGKIIKELFNFKNFLTAKSQELGSRFHSLAAATHMDTLIKPLSYLICA